MSSSVSQQDGGEAKAKADHVLDACLHYRAVCVCVFQTEGERQVPLEMKERRNAGVF